LKPKRKDSFSVVLAACMLILTIFVALHGAGAYLDIQNTPEITGLDSINSFTESFSHRILTPLSIEWNAHSRQWLMWSCFVWFIVVSYTATSKKNTIAGKEHGTAKWASPSEIKDLFADNILKKEIKKATMSRFVITRWFAKRKAYKEAKKDGEAQLRDIYSRIDDEEEARKETDGYNKKDGKRIVIEKKKAAQEENKDFIRAARVEAWQPLKLKQDYNSKVDEINMLLSNDLISNKVASEQRSEARNKYEKDIRIFYSGKEKVAALIKKYKDADALLTATERTSIYNYVINNNILILGGSGSGKTRGFVMPNILQAHSSFVITDPKGEILEKCGYFLSKIKGYEIRVLNLDNHTNSDGYNPFVYIHPERYGYEERVLRLIEAIIMNTDGGERRNSSDPFWEKAEKLFLQAIFFFVCDGFVIKERNMNTVLSLIQMLEIAEEKDNKESDLDIFARVFESKHGSEHIGVQQFKEFRSKASGKTAKSIVISAVARLAPFRTAAIRKMFSYDTMNLDQLGEKKTAIFVVLPPTDTTFNFIAGLLFTQMFQELQYCATEKHKHKGQLPVPVRFILDEFANTCTIPNFVKILAYARSFGIGIVPIIQSLEQIKNMYKDEWQVIVDNCTTRLFLGSISSMDTLEYMSKMLGKGTYDKRTTGRTRSKHGSSSQNWDVVGRELMDAAEIGKLTKEDCLLLISGRNPFYSKKYEYKDHPNYRFTSDANKKYQFEYEPKKENVYDYGNDVVDSESGANENVLIIPDIVPVVKSRDVEVTTDSRKLLEMINEGKFKHIPDDEIRGFYGEQALYNDEEADLIIDAMTDNVATVGAQEIITTIAKDPIVPIINTFELAVDAVEGYTTHSLSVIPDSTKPKYGCKKIMTDEEADVVIELFSMEDQDISNELLSNATELSNMINSMIDDLDDSLRDTENAHLR